MLLGIHFTCALFFRKTMSRYFKGWPLGLLGALFSYYYLSMDLLVFSEIFHFIYIEDRYAISILLFRSQLRIAANIEFRFFHHRKAFKRFLIRIKLREVWMRHDIEIIKAKNS